MSGTLQVRASLRRGDFQLRAEFEAAPAGVTALFGPSGAGKSQLLALIAGAGRPDEGRIALGERVLFDSERRIDVAQARRAIGWVFQDARLFPHLSVRDNLLYGARRAKGRDAGVRLEPLVEALGIGALLSRRPAGLSGGERQRVAIGRALLSQPELLLMDEPLAALDLPRRAEILPYLERLKTAAAVPVLYVTHALSEVVRLADRLVLLSEGRVEAQGPLAEVLARPDLAQLAFRPDAAAVLEGVVRGHDPARGLSRIALDGGGADLLVPPLGRPQGARIRAAVLARDVLVATERPVGLSARNILPARVEALGPARADGVVLVRLRLEGGSALLSALTAGSVEELDLKPSSLVHAVIKSVAVEGVAASSLLAAMERPDGLI